MHKLTQLYKEMTIRRKQIRVTKIVSSEKQRSINKQAKEAFNELKDLREKDFIIVYCDEVTFSAKVFQKRCWSLPNEPLAIDLRQHSSKCIAVIVCISFCRGVEYYEMFEKSVNIPKFLQFLDGLRRQHFADDIALFIDRLSVHRSRLVQERMQELSIPCIFNAAYNCDAMPCENVFAYAKKSFRERRLNWVMNGKKDEIKKNIQLSLDGIKLHDV